MKDNDDDDSCIDVERFNDPAIQSVKDELAMLRYEAVKGLGFERAAFILKEYGEEEAFDALVKYAVEQNGGEDEYTELMDELCDYCKKSAVA